MNALNQAHNKAMDFAARALYEKMQGNTDTAHTFFQQALDFEIRALDELEKMIGHVDEPLQPTHSVLHRSAATLALDCGNTTLAQQLATKGLSQNPPTEIAQEIHELLTQISHHQTLTPQPETILRDEGEQFN